MNIVIADSHVLCREALENYLRLADVDMDVRGASDYGGLMEILNHKKADIVLLEPDLAGLPMIENWGEVDLSNPDIRVGLLLNDLENIEQDLPEGAHGFFPKTLSSKAVLFGLQKIMKEGSFIPDAQMISPYSSEIENTPRKRPDDFFLTQREKEVMGFLVKGATNKDIARALDLQVVTVKLHVRGICRKINAKNRTQAALLAQENGWDL